MRKSNEYFKGTTKEAIRDIREDVKKIYKKQESMDKRIWILFIMLSIAIIERVPSIVSLAMAK